MWCPNSLHQQCQTRIQGIQRLCILSTSRIQVWMPALNNYSCLDRPCKNNRAKLFAIVAASLMGGSGHESSLGGSGWSCTKKYALGVWCSRRGQRDGEISHSRDLQDSSTLSCGWSNIRVDLGDNSEGSSLSHLKDKEGTFPALVPSGMAGSDLPAQAVVSLSVEKRARLEMSPDYS